MPTAPSVTGLTPERSCCDTVVKFDYVSSSVGIDLHVTHRRILALLPAHLVVHRQAIDVAAQFFDRALFLLVQDAGALVVELRLVVGQVVVDLVDVLVHHVELDVDADQQVTGFAAGGIDDPGPGEERNTQNPHQKFLVVHVHSCGWRSLRT